MQESKQCQNCKQNYTIESEDFDFYRKIEVPLPTFCPRCRLERRLSFLNFFNLYKRDCDLCKKSVISRYSPDAPYKVYCPKCWWSDNWDAFEYGRGYDFSRPFFEQFNELLHNVPIISLSIDIPTTKSSPYTNHTGNLKNCYLIFHGDRGENCSYGFYSIGNKDIFDCSLTADSELCYDSIHTFQSNRCVGTDHATESLECFFSRDISGCQNCFASTNIKNKKYVYFDEQLSKEEYFRKISEIDIGSYSKYQEIKKKARSCNAKSFYKGIYDKFCVNSTGNYIFNSKNIKECFETSFAEDGKYLFLIADNPTKDSYDIASWGNNMARCCDSVNIGENVSDIKFCDESGINLISAEYCRASTGGKNHFGCVSVKKGEFCVLNKRYSESEYRFLREKIIKYMDDMPYTDKKGNVYKYGELFPPEFTGFPYNDSFASLFFPKTKEAAEKEGFIWTEKEKRTYDITKKANELPDHIKDTGESILKEVIECSACGKGYRIIETELSFLKKMNLPIPRECPMCRIMEKVHRWIEDINYCQTVERKCAKCGVSFKTTLTEKNAPIIYCNGCYARETA
ncbi:hypothetical protein A3I34_01305 [Candidatus Jorgensenbacteria bacterium RIFCSPLOWO2_02_FULL_45_12]|uniref:Uncharacterized protein n=2 Tax=Candidatus Joergenseniibacteriota TaxID=1752739 RepID=A0A1F6BQD2_9BACT|nr:MAG: hypothetical protein UX22_C0001G0046 [Candidatus Jorgensenbacteria bacterium GW2011_GWA2_45_9]OGG38972.1 MAG: hypothetical protein A3D55_03095 [Candidatus Jorgensenbacteria bacterium RIFCSPHIGHO2_02_FULL_45_20]OGG42731.1 MAG: hypothetical protein A3I34_01305 [Candidatus Jorgensenbacteria bacterium RIFCSPLOWO2_02_FULL_45_12]